MIEQLEMLRIEWLDFDCHQDFKAGWELDLLRGGVLHFRISGSCVHQEFGNFGGQPFAEGYHLAYPRLCDTGIC